MTIGIIGAGLAGLSCAARLVEANQEVVLFDKGRVAGGRMATRRISTSMGDVFFDHGAQYFTAREPVFLAEVERWARAGLAERLPAARDDAWVGTPEMNAPAKALAANLDVHSSARIEALRLADDGWHLLGDAIEAGPFKTLVVAVPAEQTGALIEAWDSAFASAADATRGEPCWTVMAAFAETLPIADNILKQRGQIGWAARNSANPGRGGTESWVIQATPEWSRQHLEEMPDVVCNGLVAALGDAAGCRSVKPIAVAAHRWRYARSGHLGRGVLWNRDLRLGCCGDWLIGPRIECAWLSGRQLAEQIHAI